MCIYFGFPLLPVTVHPLAHSWCSIRLQNQFFTSIRASKALLWRMSVQSIATCAPWHPHGISKSPNDTCICWLVGIATYKPNPSCLETYTHLEECIRLWKLPGLLTLVMFPMLWIHIFDNHILLQCIHVLSSILQQTDNDYWIHRGCKACQLKLFCSRQPSLSWLFFYLYVKKPKSKWILLHGFGASHYILISSHLCSLSHSFVQIEKQFEGDGKRWFRDRAVQDPETKLLSSKESIDVSSLLLSSDHWFCCCCCWECNGMYQFNAKWIHKMRTFSP